LLVDALPKRKWTRPRATRNSARSSGASIDLQDSVVQIGDVAEKVEASDVADLPSNTLWR